MFKMLYKEWLSDQATDRMMPRNRAFCLLTGCVQNSQRKGHIFEMWTPWAAPERDSDTDQQQCHWNPGSYTGGSMVSTWWALACLCHVLEGEREFYAGWWMPLFSPLVFFSVTTEWDMFGEAKAHSIYMSFSVLLTFQGLCWHLSLEGQSKSSHIQLLPWKAGKVIPQGSGICQRHLGNYEGQLFSLFFIDFNL